MCCKELGSCHLAGWLACHATGPFPSAGMQKVILSIDGLYAGDDPECVYHFVDGEKIGN